MVLTPTSRSESRTDSLWRWHNSWDTSATGPTALNKESRAGFWPRLNARIIKTRSSLAQRAASAHPCQLSQAVSLAPLPEGQGTRTDGSGPVAAFSAAQMAHSVSGLATRRGGALTSSHDWIRQLLFAPPPPTPVDCTEAREGVYSWQSSEEPAHWL